jgi:hypothetical protein
VSKINENKENKENPKIDLIENKTYYSCPNLTFDQNNLIKSNYQVKSRIKPKRKIQSLYYKNKNVNKKDNKNDKKNENDNKNENENENKNHIFNLDKFENDKKIPYYIDKEIKIDRKNRKNYLRENKSQKILKTNFNFLLKKNNIRIKYHVDKKIIYSKDKNITPVNFIVKNLFFCGNPLSLFLTIQNSQDNFIENMETVEDFHNIIHPMDPICYRIEPIIKDFPRSPHSFTLPNWENDYDLFKQDLINYFDNIFSLKDKKKEEDNKPYLFDDKINRKRFDFILKEKFSENLFNFVGYLFSHMNYWDNLDVIFFIINVIHSQKFDILIK